MDHLVVGPLLVLALLSSGTAVLVYRADPARRSNRLFALLSSVDALTQLLRAVYVLSGHPLTDVEVLGPCFYGSMVVAAASVAFAYSFPFDDPVPRGLWAWLGLHLGLALLLTATPSTRAWFLPHCNELYFVPMCIGTLYLLGRNFRRLPDRRPFPGIPMMMGAVAVRWASSMAAFTVARRVSDEWFSVLLHLDATLVYGLCYVLAAYGILKDQLFRVRGAFAEVFLYGGFVLLAFALAYVGVEASLTRIHSPTGLRVALVAMAAVPILALVTGRRVLRLVEARILGPIHPQRAQAQHVLQRVFRETASEVAPAALVSITEAAVAELVGGEVRCLGASRGPRCGAALPAPLEAYFFDFKDPYLHLGRAHDLSAEAKRALVELSADFFFPVRREGVLFGVLLVRGAELDRDLAQSVCTLSGHLALKLQYAALFEEMLRLRSELSEAQRLAELGSFAAAIAHDIRTPLTSVQMNVQILRGKSQLPPDDMEYFDIALEELKRLSAHVSQLLDFAKPVRVEKSPLDLREWVDETARNLEPLLTGKHLVLEREHQDGVPPVLADAERLRQVLVNLVDNAAQASTQGTAIRVITRREDGGRAAIEVRDQGKGIAAENLEKIFEPFFTTRADGTGLGLAIAQKLVRAHGGEIRVRSSPGAGASFTVVLPGQLAAQGTR